MTPDQAPSQAEIGIQSDADLEKALRQTLGRDQEGHAEEVVLAARVTSGVRGYLVLTSWRLLFLWKKGRRQRNISHRYGDLSGAGVSEETLFVATAEKWIRYWDFDPVGAASEVAGALHARGVADVVPDLVPVIFDPLATLDEKTRALAVANIGPGESVRAVIKGVGPPAQALVALDERILIVKRGVGANSASYPFAQISGVEVQTYGFSRLSAYIEIKTAGVTQHPHASHPHSTWRSDKQDVNPSSLPNCLSIVQAQIPLIQPAINAIRQRIASGHWPDAQSHGDAEQAPAEPAPTSAEVDLAGQLERLAELHRRGALTDDELTQAKQKLLG